MKLKKVTVCEDNLWECDIHYLIKNNDIHTCFNEILISIIGSWM